MTYLLIILLFFGLLQSFFELRNNDSNNNKLNIGRILSIIYIGGFVVGLIIIIAQDKESNQFDELIKDISHSVSKIDTLSIEQIEKISKSINKTETLIHYSDSINKKMVDLIEIKDSLLTQYNNINIKLSKQIEIDRKKLIERAPIISLTDNNLNWEGSDSTSYSIKACVRNYGKRSAMILEGSGYAVFFDEKNNPFFHLDFPGNSNKKLLEPNELEKMTLCYYSHGVYDFNVLTKSTNFAIICLKIRYQDIIGDNPEVEYFYNIWKPKLEFGGPKYWQIQLAKEWADKNQKFE